MSKHGLFLFIDNLTKSKTKYVTYFISHFGHMILSSITGIDNVILHQLAWVTGAQWFKETIQLRMGPGWDPAQYRALSCLYNTYHRVPAQYRALLCLYNTYHRYPAQYRALSCLYNTSHRDPAQYRALSCLYSIYHRDPAQYRALSCLHSTYHSQLPIKIVKWKAGLMLSVNKNNKQKIQTWKSEFL